MAPKKQGPSSLMRSAHEIKLPAKSAFKAIKRIESDANSALLILDVIFSQDDGNKSMCKRNVGGLLPFIVALFLCVATSYAGSNPPYFGMSKQQYDECIVSGNGGR